MGHQLVIVSGVVGALAYADLVLRRWGLDCPGTGIGRLTVEEFTACLEVPAGPAAGELRHSPVFVPVQPGRVRVPRTRPALCALAGAASLPLRRVVPVVTSATAGGDRVTIADAAGAGAGPGAAMPGVELDAPGARLALSLHAVAPWSRAVEPVSALDGVGAPLGLRDAVAALRRGSAKQFLVFAPPGLEIEPHHQLTVVRVRCGPEHPGGGGRPVSVGRRSYALLEEWEDADRRGPASA